MRTVSIKVEKVPPPIGARFKVYAFDIREHPHLPKGIFLVDTGINLLLPSDMTLEISSFEGVFVLGHTLGNCNFNSDDKMMSAWRLVVFACGRLERGEPFASVTLFKKDVEPVRFVEKGPDGGRIIRGEPRNVDGAKTPESEPGG